MTMKHIALFFTFCFIYLGNISSQTYYHYSKTQYTYGPYYFSEGMNLVEDIIAYKRMQKKKEEFAAAMRTRTQEIRDYYESFEQYPEKIADGWHKVTIVAGSDFIDNRKVFVQNNKITKVVWDDWMEEELASAGPIKKAQCKIQLNGNNPNLNRFLDVYFINAIADPNALAKAPQKSGTITFWTSDPKPENISLSFNNVEYGRFKKSSPAGASPKCGDITEITIYMKPGIYSYQAIYEKGNNVTLADTKLEIRENTCESVYIPSKKETKKKK